jgi:imidazolonepropionase-like amidohydrolase
MTAPATISALYADALFDPATGETLRNATIVSQGGRVTRAGKRDQVRVPVDATRVDAEGLTVLPGLIDCHVHLRSKGEGRDMVDWLGTPPSLWVLQTVPSSRKTLDAGFTAVRDAGGAPAAVRMAIERGYFPGPRVKCAVTAISQTGGHTDLLFPCGADIRPQIADVPPYVVDGVEPMRKRVREVIRAGADWIKLCTSGGMISPSDSPHHAALTLDEVRAAVDEAAAQGRKVMAHAQATQGIKNALVAGVATIEHGVFLDDETIELMLEGRRALVPTLAATVWVLRHADQGRMPAWASDKARSVFEDHKRSIKRAIDAKVRIAFGTDTGVGAHGSMGEEFLLMRDLGLSPLDCIRSATTLAAETLDWSGHVGTLAEGAFADAIGVAGDPVADLTLLAKPENIRLVLKGGEVAKRLS